MNRNVRKGGTNKPSGSYTSNFTIACVIIVAILVFANFKIFSGIITKNPENVASSDGATATATSQSSSDKDEENDAIKADIANNFEKISVSSDDTKCGNLILVNNDYAFTFSTSPKAVKSEELVPFYGNQSDDYVVSYPSRETLTPTAIKAFNGLTAEFAGETGIRNLLVLDSYRTYEDQERVYENKGGSIATLPGHSEHHTGLAFDLEIYNVGDFDGTGEYAYIAKNCHKYGYILRYPEDKTSITGISYEPWHFRYVGKEHANYMHQNNLCLEEYISLLASYPIDSARLTINTDDGETYIVYSQSVNGSDGEIYVPKNYAYSLSGDNCGHVIVSYKVS